MIFGERDDVIDDDDPEEYRHLIARRNSGKTLSTNRLGKLHRALLTGEYDDTQSVVLDLSKTPMKDNDFENIIKSLSSLVGKNAAQGMTNELP